MHFYVLFVSLEYYISLKCFKFSVSDFILPFLLKTKRKSLSSSLSALHKPTQRFEPCKRESMCLTEPGLALRISRVLTALQDIGTWGPCGVREKSWHTEEATWNMAADVTHQPHYSTQATEAPRYGVKTCSEVETIRPLGMFCKSVNKKVTHVKYSVSIPDIYTVNAQYKVLSPLAIIITTWLGTQFDPIKTVLYLACHSEIICPKHL